MSGVSKARGERKTASGEGRPRPGRRGRSIGGVGLDGRVGLMGVHR